MRRERACEVIRDNLTFSSFLNSIYRCPLPLSLPPSLFPSFPSSLHRHMKGRLILTFYERRRTQSFFRLIQNEERVVFEEWVIPFLIDNIGMYPYISPSPSPSPQTLPAFLHSPP